MDKQNWRQILENNKMTTPFLWVMFLFFSLSITTLLTQSIDNTYSNLAAVSTPRTHSFNNNRSVPIPGQYIIEFNDSAKTIPGLAKQLASQNSGEILFTYNDALKGFAARFPEQALNGLRNNPHVKSIEQDQTVYINASGTQNPVPTWGLDRIDQRALPLNNQYSYQNDASNVYAYVIDTGIEINHSEFQGRASYGYDFIDNDQIASDCNGHGTHVAGTIGGTNTGVAKNVKLVAMRTMNCSGSGSWSGVIAAIDWIIANGQRPAVINMSIGGSLSSSLNNAIANAFQKGIISTVAAGNSSSDACNSSPSSAPSALTVAASESNDYQSGYSNYGSCVDIYAPGNSITSSWINGGYATLSGTSMATPHVAGVAALYLAGTPNATPSQISYAITQDATQGAVSNPTAGTPNRLLYSMNTLQVQNPPADTQAPTVPSNLVATSQDSTKINLSWSPSTDNVSVVGYKIMRNSTQIATTASPSYMDTNVSSGSTYNYTVRAFDSAGNTSADSNQTSATVPVAAFDISSYTITNKTSSGVTISWTTNYPGNGNVSYSKSGGAVNTITSNLTNVTNNQVTITGLTRNTSYNFTINAAQTGTGSSDSVSGTFKTRPK